ncbi:MAG: carbohydrate ABC transporter permease [Saccharofermentanales bacterium]
MSKKKKFHLSRTLFILSCVIYPLINFAVFSIYINFKTFILAFQRFNKFKGIWEFVGFDNFKDVIHNIFNERIIGLGVVNTGIWIVVTVGVLLPISILVAYILFKKIPLSNFYRIIFFLPTIISIVIMTMVFSFMVNPNFGVVNQALRILGLGQFARVWLGNSATALPTVLFYCIWVGIGYNVVILNGAMSRISPEIFEYNKILGIGPMTEMIKVVVPMVWPTISTFILVGTVGTFGVFLQSKLLTNGGPNGATNTIGLTIMQNVTDGMYGEASAYGLLVAVAGFLITRIIRYFLDKVDIVEY